MRGWSLIFEIVIVKNYEGRMTKSHYFLRIKPNVGKQNQEIEKREKEIHLLLLSLSEFLIQPGFMRNLLEDFLFM